MKQKTIVAHIALITLLTALLVPNVTLAATQKTPARTTVKTSLYKSASTKKKIAALPKNAKITITGERGKCYKAVYGKKKGYVLKSKVKLSPKPTPTPTPEMKVEGKAYGEKVCEGVNEMRELNDCAPLTYDGSGSLMDRCKEMAKGGKLLAPTGSNESTSKSDDGGKTMGIFSAVHAWGISNGDYTKLYVASVVYKGTRWTIVRAE